MSEKEFVKEVMDREYEDYLVDGRNSHIESYRDWKNRISEADALIRGDWEVLFPNKLKAQEKPMVQNLAEVMARDVPRLVADTEPSLRAMVGGDSKKHSENQYLREAIAQTHWVVNEGDLLVPMWAMDLIVTGAAFSVSWYDSSSEYPRFERIDPRFCFPDFFNGKIQDLFVIQVVKARIFKNLYPDIDLPDMGPGDEIEIVDYYGPNKMVKAAMVTHGNTATSDKTFILDSKECDYLAVDFAMLPTHDGAFRGLIDQYAPSLEAKNRIARLMVQYTEQQVASPIIEKGVLNSNAKPGPMTVYHLDPTVPDSTMGRLQPAGGSPQLFALMSLLDSEQRGGIGYPASRQGEVSQSIASGSFVASTQGQLTSIVRECMRLISKMREDIHETLYHIDEEYLDFRKSLLVSGVSNKATYKPKDDIKGMRKLKVLYGASAGLDRLQADVRLLQLYSAGIITAETARENLEFIDDPETESDKWEMEQSRKAVLQRFLADPNTPFDLVLETLIGQEDGKSFIEALKESREKMKQQAEADQMAAQQQPPTGPEGTPPSPAMEEEAMMRGAVPPSPENVPAGGEVEFNPPPLQQVFVSGR